MKLGLMIDIRNVKPICVLLLYLNRMVDFDAIFKSHDRIFWAYGKLL
jgi:hypothetical protein